jgi:hypothetical protein
VIQPAVAPPPKDAQRAFSPLIQGVKDKPGFNALRINAASTNYKRQSFPVVGQFQFPQARFSIPVCGMIGIP